MPPNSYTPQSGQAPQGGPSHSPQPGLPPRPGQPYAAPQQASGTFDPSNGQLPAFQQPHVQPQPHSFNQANQYGQAGPTTPQSAYLGQMAVPQQQPHLTRLPGASNSQTPGVVPPPPPRPETPYDFFMANQPTKKKGMFDGRKPSKLVMVAAAGVALVLVLGVVALFLPQEETKVELVSVAQSQAETLRICNEGEKNVKQPDIRSFVINCSLSLSSEQRTLNTLMSRSGVSVDGAILAAGRKPASDRQLSAAKSASNFDEAFVTVAEAQLTSYGQTIRQASLSSNTSATEKEVLNQQYESSQLLLQQLKNPSS